MSASSQRSADATAQNQARLRKHLLPQRLRFCQQPLERKSSPLENRSCWGSPWASPRTHGKAAASSGRSRGNQSSQRCSQQQQQRSQRSCLPCSSRSPGPLSSPPFPSPAARSRSKLRRLLQRTSPGHGYSAGAANGPRGHRVSSCCWVAAGERRTRGTCALPGVSS